MVHINGYIWLNIWLILMVNILMVIIWIMMVINNLVGGIATLSFWENEGTYVSTLVGKIKII